MSNLKAKVVMAVFGTAVFVASAMQSEASAGQKEIVKFRLTVWMTAHFDDTKSAQSTFDAMKKLGCEAKRAQHSGHTDVTYRCLQWRSVALKTHKEAHQWERWLKSYGFQTSHSH